MKFAGILFTVFVISESNTCLYKNSDQSEVCAFQNYTQFFSLKLILCSYSMNNRRKETVWKYFKRTQDAGVCQIENCGKRIKAGGGSTSGLHAHLRTIHKINLLKSKIVNSSNEIENVQFTQETSCNSRKKITAYFKKPIDESLSAVVSRLVAKDGLAFRTICTSYDIRSLLKTKGYMNIPKSVNSIRKLVMEYAENIRKQIIEEFLSRKKENTKLSITIDEWTSKRNRRFMNVTVHEKSNFWNLGLARVHGKMPAEKCDEVLRAKLLMFNLHYRDLVGITTDGASVMKKFGHLVPMVQQLCFAHGIQLAVVEVLYGKVISAIELQVDEERNTTKDSSDDEILDEEMNNDDESMNIIIDCSSQNIIENPDINELIDKIRKIVKIFRKSATKNDEILQKHVVEEFGKEKSLIIDSKTRWNSLLDMLERFYELKNCVRKSLIDLEIDINFTQNDMDLAYDLISVLQPVKVAVETICCDDANLFTADITLKFMLDELSKQNSTIGCRLKEKLMKRIRERRTKYSDILQFLHNCEEINKNEYSLFNVISKSVVTKLIIEIIEQLRGSNDNLNILSNNSDDDDEDIVAMPVAEDSINTPSLKERLHQIIKEKSHFSKIITRDTNNVSKEIRNEINLFCNNNVRGKYLDLVYNHLLTIKPTSVCSERAFSAAGLFCTKIRTRLDDITLDNLCILRAYFNRQKNLQSVGSES